jgi:hypothetical protein
VHKTHFFFSLLPPEDFLRAPPASGLANLVFGLANLASGLANLTSGLANLVSGLANLVSAGFSETAPLNRRLRFGTDFYGSK